MKFCLTLIVVVALSAPAHAQTDSMAAGKERSLCGTIGKDGRTALRAAGVIFSAPLRWDGNDWLLASGIVVTTGAVSLLDRDVSTLMDNNRTPLNDDLQKVAVQYGDGLNILVLVAGTYATGLLIDDDWLRETAVLTGTSVLISGTISTLAKMAVGRARPYAGLGNHHFHPFNLKDEFHSFPSGHTMTAFSVSGILAARIKNPWASVGLYGLATLSSVSRLYSRDHWLSDIVFSAAYSTAIAHSIVDWFEKGEGRNADAGLRIVPGPGYVVVRYGF